MKGKVEPFLPDIEIYEPEKDAFANRGYEQSRYLCFIAIEITRIRHLLESLCGAGASPAPASAGREGGSGEVTG
jgi:hypothetical protein